MGRKKQRARTRYWVGAAEQGPWKDAGSIAKARSVALDKLESGATQKMFLKVENPSEGTTELFTMEAGTSPASWRRV